jgi:hypothetical protein
MRLGAAIVGMILLLAGIGGYGQSGLPDLVVKSVRVSPGDLEEGQAALVRAVIANQGQGDALGGFDVILELNGQELATRSFFELKKDKSTEIQIPWKALRGSHTLTVSVDAPFSRIRETNESNNKVSLQFVVSPVLGVRSFSLDVVKLFGRVLSETGVALHFKLTDSVFTSLDNAVNAINEAAAALRNISLEFELVRGSVPQAFSSDPLYREAQALATLYESIAESFERIAVMLSIGNFDAVLENAYLLRAKLVELSQKTLGDVRFVSLGSAVARFDQVIALAKELRDLLKGAQGRSQYQVAVELFNAFMAFGDELSACAQQLIRLGESRAALFSNGDAPIDGAYSTKHPLIIQWGGVMLMRIELYDLRSGALVFRSEEIGPGLEVASNGSLETGMYGYRLLGITKHGVHRVEIGRLLVKQANSIPPMSKQNVPMGMSGH